MKQYTLHFQDILGTEILDEEGNQIALFGCIIPNVTIPIDENIKDRLIEIYGNKWSSKDNIEFEGLVTY